VVDEGGPEGESAARERPALFAGLFRRIERSRRERAEGASRAGALGPPETRAAGLALCPAAEEDAPGAFPAGILWSDLTAPPAPALLDRPLVTFHTPGGTSFWHLALPPDDRVTLCGAIRRAFGVLPRGGAARVCLVDALPPVRAVVAAEAGHDFGPEEPLWDVLCRIEVVDRLCAGARLTSEPVEMARLGVGQLEIVRRIAQTSRRREAALIRQLRPRSWRERMLLALRR